MRRFLLGIRGFTVIWGTEKVQKQQLTQAQQQLNAQIESYARKNSGFFD